MQTIFIVFHLFLAAGLIGLILIQHGKGADMGAAFGSGASGTVFGAKGSASFLTRLTAGLATLFFVTSMVMAYFATQRDEGSDLFKDLQAPAAAEQQAPVPQSDIPPVPGGVPAGENELPPVAVSDEAAQAGEAAPAPIEGEAVPQAEGAVQAEAVSAAADAAVQPESQAPAQGEESAQTTETAPDGTKE